MLTTQKTIINLIIIAMIIALMSGCFNKDKQEDSRYNTFIQIDLSDSSNSIIGKIRKIITPLINDIIRQELQINQQVQSSMDNQTEIPQFRTPKRGQQLITIYYIDGLLTDNENQIINALNDLEKSGVTGKFANILSLSDEIRFFGNKQEEIVILVNDPNNYLKSLNQEMRSSFSNLNNNFKKSFNKDLYSISKSERFEYIPHVAIGRLQADSIRALAPNEEEGQKMLETIKERIAKEVFPEIVKLLIRNGKKLDVNSFCFFDKQHNCLKKFKLLKAIIQRKRYQLIL